MTVPQPVKIALTALMGITLMILKDHHGHGL